MLVHKIPGEQQIGGDQEKSHYTGNGYAGRRIWGSFGWLASSKLISNVTVR